MYIYIYIYTNVYNIIMCRYYFLNMQHIYKKNDPA